MTVSLNKITTRELAWPMGTEYRAAPQQYAVLVGGVRVESSEWIDGPRRLKADYYGAPDVLKYQSAFIVSVSMGGYWQQVDGCDSTADIVATLVSNGAPAGTVASFMAALAHSA